jgi:two-component system sensor histidine kinase TctE
MAWLFAAMALVFSANLLSSYYSNIEAADSAYDRLLLASASAIAERTVLREDGLHVDVPYVALDMLASTAQDRVFYAVSAPDGKVVTGYDDLPLPERRDGDPLQDPVFYNSEFKQASVRIVALRSFVSGRNLSGYVTIQVAQTRRDRDGLTYSLLRQSALWMLVIAITGAIAAWFGVSIGLRPLARLREALGRRSPDDVRPVLHDVPNEFKPLVGAINGMLYRLEGGLSSMRNFISDASHQLKTPLASLQAQSEMALRETDPDDVRKALVKVNKSAKRTSRLVQQLLSHARATGASEAFADFDLVQLVRETIEILLPRAIAKNIDLGYEGDEREWWKARYA